MPELGLIVLLALASYRVTRFVVLDRVASPVFDRIRERFEARWIRVHSDTVEQADEFRRSAVWNSQVAYLLSCPWCLGFWVSGVGTLIVSSVYGLEYPILTWLAVSTIVGFLGRIDND